MGMSGDDADMVLSSLQKVILSTRIKVKVAFSLKSFTVTYKYMFISLTSTVSFQSVCNIGVWCISVQQLNPLFLNAHIESLVRAIVHALDNPTGSLSTTFEAMQVCQCCQMWLTSLSYNCATLLYF